jgi:alkanesulfonate monooxygenase SsuD/methylene tetrahydromethanopterin reductase-like flavin-dependent oxidoreductase (luciferase family)
VLVSVTIICAETGERAEELTRPYEVLIAQALTGQQSPLFTTDQAAGYTFRPRERQLITTLRGGGVRGDARHIEHGLAALISRFVPDELIVTIPVYEIQDRLQALEVIAGKADSIPSGNRPATVSP